MFNVGQLIHSVAAIGWLQGVVECGGVFIYIVSNKREPKLLYKQTHFSIFPSSLETQKQVDLGQRPEIKGASQCYTRLLLSTAINNITTSCTCRL